MQAVLGNGVQRGVQVGVPDAVLAVLAAGVGLVAVAVAKARVDAQPHAVALRCSAQLVQHVDGAGVHRHFVLDHGGQRGFVHHVGGEDDVRRLASGHIAGCHRAQDFATRDGIHLHALLAHQLQDVDVGAGLLCKADGVKGLELGNALTDHLGVIHPQRGAERIGQVPQLFGRERAGHGFTFS